mmetsp:Transcript_20268/g.40158  ORF Transcript_20268/g.40158 Transcript_20268/m.40158 type:complete len:786 (+) Transcript_20268:29-2386(+)|eukprot:CAMPEP_0175141078 /NCGR_PEP_ID=MMETSP0087-20121206/11884_1 /TAXON_ID=136419 /ORGANISM="Unknown Unknown, Strain D1" /LENGTH=785 /DNA_ID=CAMNT_0016424411 /DNA_START=28 /DNA_END=2385 /DNA_ORIENTATION=-
MGNQIAKKKGKAREAGSTIIIRQIEPDEKVGEEIAGVPLFSHLNESERAKLGGALKEVRFSPGEYVLKQDEPGEIFYVIKSGTAVVTRYNQPGEAAHEVCRLEEGDYFGEQALLHKCNRNASVHCPAAGSQELICWALHEEKFEVLFQTDRLNVNFLERTTGLFEQRREAVTAGVDETENHQAPLPIIKMSQASAELLFTAVSSSLLFSSHDEQTRRAVVEVMYLQELTAGEVLIKQGDEGDKFYCVEDGEFDVFQHARDTNTDKRVDFKKRGDSFGELALMYDAPRNATVIAKSRARVRVLERSLMNRIIKEQTRQRISENVEFLKKVQLLSALNSHEREILAQAMQTVNYPEHSVVFRQNEPGDAMYLVKQGTVLFVVTDEHGKDKVISGAHGACTAGGYFGERALMNDTPRNASVVTKTACTFLRVDRSAFELILGPLEKLLKKKEATYADKAVKQDGGKPTWKGEDIKFEDLVDRAVLGRGAYGFVTLVEDKTTKKLYALKAVGKQRIVDTRQKRHIFNEKNYMAKMNHPFVIKLHQTFQDSDQLYFLIEASIGGELFRILRRVRTFPEKTSRFYAACVILAFEYLHSLNLIYRDLKPENLLIDTEGYLKVTDFGFVKEVGSKKTFTVCGTQEYMAPEIIARTGHGKSVDWWTVGIFIYEMLVSYTPFYKSGEEPMQMYKRILSRKVKYPSQVGADAKDLISKLLAKDDRRLGGGSAGASAIKSHKWFAKFDWEGLLWRKLKAPFIPSKKELKKFKNFAQGVARPVLKPYQDDGSNWDKDF